LRRAGTVILGVNILLWFLATYPHSTHIEKEFQKQREDLNESTISIPSELKKTRLEEIDRQEAGEKLRNRFAGEMGRAIEPVIAPLGFDWKMGIGVISSFAARE